MADSISDITNNLNSEMLGFKTFYDEKYNNNKENEDEQKKRDELMKEAGRLEAQSLTLINMLDDIASRSPYDELFSMVAPNALGGNITAPSRSIIDDINDDYRKSIERQNTKPNTKSAGSDDSKIVSGGSGVSNARMPVMSPNRQKEKVVYLGDVLPPSYHKQTRSSKDGTTPAVVKSSIERVYHDNNTNVGLMQRVADIEYQAAYDAMMKIQAIRHGLGHRVEELDNIHSEVIGGVYYDRQPHTSSVKSSSKVERQSNNDPSDHRLPYKSELSLMTDEVHHVHDSIGKTSRIIGTTLDEVIASLKYNLSHAPAPTPVPNPVTGQHVTPNTVPHGPSLVKTLSLDRLQCTSNGSSAMPSNGSSAIKKSISTEKIFDLESAVKASDDLIRLPREMYHSPVPRMQYESNPNIPSTRPSFNTAKPVAPAIVRPSSTYQAPNESYANNPVNASAISSTSSLYDRQQYLKRLQRERQCFSGY